MYELNVHLRNNKTASMGIGAMIIFIAMVLIAGIAASILVQTAGTLERKSMAAGQQTTAEVSTGLRVVDIEGQYINRSMAYNTSTGLHWNFAGRQDGDTSFRGWRNYSRIHAITMTITPRSGSADIDLSCVIFEISNSTTKCLLTYDSNNFNATVESDGVFGTEAFDLGADKFGIIEIEDADNSCSATAPVVNKGDMVMLTVNTSACFWGLEKLDDMWGTIQPEEGSSALFAFRVPASLSDVINDLY